MYVIFCCARKVREILFFWWKLSKNVKNVEFFYQTEVKSSTTHHFFFGNLFYPALKTQFILNLTFCDFFFF